MLEKFRHITSKSTAIVLSVAIGFSSVAPLYAQDSEAPVLIHRQIDSGVAGELQTFLARVSDDFGVESVVLFYRQADSGEFTRIPMRPLLDSIGEYMIAIETSESSYQGLQYYIEATDAVGNTTNRGFSYAPIVLPLTAPVTTATNTTPSPILTPEPSPESRDAGISPTTILLGVGALLALGALVSSGSGDDDGGGGAVSTNPGTNNPGTPITTTTPNTITLTVTSELPGTN